MTATAVRRIRRLPLCLPLCLILCCAALTAAFDSALANNAPQTTAALGDATAAPTDAEFADLLTRTERQISDGKVIAPPDDSALQTWSLVLQHQAAALNSPAIRKDLEDFAALARSRAVEEKEAGKVSVAIDFTVFADLATQLLNHTPEAKPQETQPTPAPTASAPAPASPGPAPEPPRAADPASAPIAAASPPAPPLPSPPAAIPVAPPPAAPVIPSPGDQTSAAFYLRRGNEMLANKDISAARKFYEFAANAGSAQAASALARTLEPRVLMQLGVRGIKPDPELAKFWYRRAASLGDRDAAVKLQALDASAAK